MSNPLLTLREAIEFSPVDAHSYMRERARFIPIYEENLFNECFGWTFYESLLSDRIIYLPVESTETGTKYKQYSRTGTYTAGEYVLDGECIYKVLQNVGTGGKPISDAAYFSVAPKFANEHFEILWRRYLGAIIAFSVNQSSVVYRSIKDTAKGIVKMYDPDGSRPATFAEVRGLKQEYASDIDTMIRAMEAYISRNAGNFPGYIGNLGECEDGTGECNKMRKTHRNLGFNIESV